jgi:hypothetical protein
MNAFDASRDHDTSHRGGAANRAVRRFGFRHIGSALVVLACLTLVACASTFRSDVARFHRLNDAPHDAQFVVVPADAGKQGSIEFAQYAALIRRELSGFGYRPLSEAGAADLTVEIGYGVSKGEQVVRSRPTIFYGFYGLHGHSSPFYTGYWYRGALYGDYPFGYGDVYTETMYTRTLNMVIVRIGDSGREILFEGEVVSVGRDRRLPEIMPYLVQAMFTNFPGESGVTKEVVIKLSDRDGRH